MTPELEDKCFIKHDGNLEVARVIRTNHAAQTFTVEVLRNGDIIRNIHFAKFRKVAAEDQSNLPECDIEAHVRKFFGLPENVQETDKVDADFGILVNLVATGRDALNQSLKESAGFWGRFAAKNGQERDQIRSQVKALTTTLKNLKQVAATAYESTKGSPNWQNYHLDEKGEAETHETLLVRAIEAAEAALSGLPMVDSEVTEITSALIKAENFIAGFEDDDIQEGMEELLAEIRAALRPMPDEQPLAEIYGSEIEFRLQVPRSQST